MYVSLTSFVNPFSFFCIPESEHVTSPKNSLENYAAGKPKMDFTLLKHGQYIAVFHNDNWARGVVSLENQILIWLVDHGMYLRPNLHTVYKELPDPFKKLPSKVFEASLHGVVAVTKIIEDFSAIKTVKSTVWAKGAVEEAKELINRAVKIRFEPIALTSTKHNDVVIGDLYLCLNGLNFMNIIDILEKQPLYLMRDKEFYIENLQEIYTNRRQHHACSLKPELPGNVPTFDINDLNIQTYNNICGNLPNVTPNDNDTESVAATNNPDNDNDFQISLTPAEIEEYSTKYITIDGTDVNVLNLLKNKARDFAICAKYKNMKSVGRASSKRDFEMNFY